MFILVEGDDYKFDKFFIKEMENKTNVDIEGFKDLLRHHHYSAAFIFYLLAKLESLECTHPVLS